jgi:hypothetical protein
VRLVFWGGVWGKMMAAAATLPPPPPPPAPGRGRGRPAQVENVEPVAETLEELWLSYNSIEKLVGHTPARSVWARAVHTPTLFSDLGFVVACAAGARCLICARTSAAAP